MSDDPSLPTPEVGAVNPVVNSPTSTSLEDALLGVEDAPARPHEPMVEDSDAQEFFNNTDSVEALNYLSFLHDTKAISFDRFNELRALLDKTPGFI